MLGREFLDYMGVLLALLVNRRKGKYLTVLLLSLNKSSTQASSGESRLLQYEITMEQLNINAQLISGEIWLSWAFKLKTDFSKTTFSCGNYILGVICWLFACSIIGDSQNLLRWLNWCLLCTVCHALSINCRWWHFSKDSWFQKTVLSNPNRCCILDLRNMPHHGLNCCLQITVSNKEK